MRLLAIETSAHVGAICVLHDGVATNEIVRDELKLSAWLVPAIDRTLSRLNVSLSSMDAIAFGAGPGSFTGARTACATAQAIAYAHGKPLIAVNSAEALAVSALSFISPFNKPAVDITVILDARMNELYTATFIGRNEQELALRGSVGLQSCQTVRVSPSSILLGSGAMLIANADEFDREQVTALTHAAEANWAQGVARMAAVRFARGEQVDPIHAAPHYVRNNVAKTEAQRALSASAAALSAAV